MARQHPGETPGSIMMEGALDFLLGNSLEAELLRYFFTFYVIPILNPDGVVHGNYRCNLNGIDLNRVWNSPHRVIGRDLIFNRTTTIPSITQKNSLGNFQRRGT